MLFMTSQLQHAVIIGELAESKKIKQEQMGRVPDLIKLSCAEVNKNRQPEQAITLEITRMDQFMALVEKPTEALKSLLMLASEFRYISHRELGLRTEFKTALALGPVEFRREALRESDGTAIRQAAETFENMKRHQRLMITSPDTDVNEEFAVACSFMDILIHDWSDEQAEAVFLSLSGLNQLQISDKLNISQPAVNRRLKAAHLDAIDKFIQRYQSLIK